MISPEIKNTVYEQLWNNALVGIALVAEDGRFLATNPVFCQITEYSQYELQQKRFQDITHPEDVDADVEESRLVASNNGKNDYVLRKRYITKTGKIVWIILKVNRIENKDGNFLFFMSQISELLEIAPPIENKKTYTFSIKRWMKDYAGWIFATATATGIIIAEILKRLSE